MRKFNSKDAELKNRVSPCDQLPTATRLRGSVSHISFYSMVQNLNETSHGCVLTILCSRTTPPWPPRASTGTPHSLTFTVKAPPNSLGQPVVTQTRSNPRQFSSKFHHLHDDDESKSETCWTLKNQRRVCAAPRCVFYAAPASTKLRKKKQKKKQTIWKENSDSKVAFRLPGRARLCYLRCRRTGAKLTRRGAACSVAWRSALTHQRRISADLGAAHGLRSLQPGMLRPTRAASPDAPALLNTAADARRLRSPRDPGI